MATILCLSSRVCLCALYGNGVPVPLCAARSSYTSASCTWKVDGGTRYAPHGRHLELLLPGVSWFRVRQPIHHTKLTGCFSKTLVRAQVNHVPVKLTATCKTDLDRMDCAKPSVVPHVYIIPFFGCCCHTDHTKGADMRFRQHRTCKYDNTAPVRKHPNCHVLCTDAASSGSQHWLAWPSSRHEITSLTAANGSRTDADVPGLACYAARGPPRRTCVDVEHRTRAWTSSGAPPPAAANAWSPVSSSLRGICKAPQVEYQGDCTQTACSVLTLGVGNSRLSPFTARAGLENWSNWERSTASCSSPPVQRPPNHPACRSGRKLSPVRNNG